MKTTIAKTADANATPPTPFYATRNFTDAGNETSFVEGAEVNADAGTLANYAAAGLVSATKPAAPETAAA